MGFEIDDEILQTFLEEAKEHLDGIESDFLEIEEMGADIDEELVNRVFRSAHSIKGGSGFLGLEVIKKLSHGIENVLDMIRNKELVPTSKVSSTVLTAFDKLSELINDSENSNDADISEYIVDLEAITTENLDESEKESIHNLIEVKAPDGKVSFNVTEFDLSHARKGNNILYILEYDLIHDVQRNDITPLDVLKLLEDIGIIVDIKIGITNVGNLDSDVTSIVLPMFVLFSTIIEEDLIGSVTKLDDDKMIVIPEDTEEFNENISSSPESEVEEKIEVIEEVKSESVNVENVSEKKSHPIAKKESKPVPKGDKKPRKIQPIVQKSDTLRVKLSVLDELMNRAAQLVLARNQLVQAIQSKNQNDFDIATKEIDQVSSELQDAIMLTRMQPIKTIFSKFPRVVRDLSQDLGKNIELIMEGKEVELDKTMIEGLGDPLLHIVRNSIDHGIELPEERKKNNKPEVGTILLSAFHESGLINIEIKDDGKGLDPDKLAMSAVEKGLYSEKEVLAMSDEEKTNLIMLPGFSTAAKVTEVSGRGVGMDVVKSNIDIMGGSVEIKSTLGVGTSIRIKLPLTLAIISSLLIKSHNLKFAVPQVNVSEVLTLSQEEMRKQIKKVGDAEVLILRGELVPLMKLNDILELEQKFLNPISGKWEVDRRMSIGDERFEVKQEEKIDEIKPDKDESVDDRRCIEGTANINIIIVNSGMYKYGMVVDELQDNIEIVVKPLGIHLKSLIEYTGATILGDGNVALILDIAGIATKAELSTIGGKKTGDAMILKAQDKEDNKETVNKTMLLFKNGPDENCAMYLSKVARLEQIKVEDIEIVGGKKVIKYRGGSLPVYALEEVASVGMLEDTDSLIVIIFNVHGNEVGLLTVPPVDAINMNLMVDQRNSHLTGILGTTIINEKTTLIIDTDEVMRILNPQWYEQEESFPSDEVSNNRESVENVKEAVKEVTIKKNAQATSETKEKFDSGVSSTNKKTKILVVEDSAFFLAQVKKMIVDEGMEVIGAEDGQDGWDKLQKHKDEIAVVVTDLEMPVMDGFELTRKIKNDKLLKNIPVIALTSLAGEEEIEKGKLVGIDEYQIKLDKNKMLESVKKYYEMVTA